MPFREGHTINVRHGAAVDGRHSPEYRSWDHMKQRCLNPRSDGYAEYGAKGIMVCDRWLSFDAFIEDMGPRPAGTSLDRIDGTKGYMPGNCRWATSSLQVVNQRLSNRNRSGVRGLSWSQERQKWVVHIKRNGRYVLTVRICDFFEACCLVKSFEAKEAPGARDA